MNDDILKHVEACGVVPVIAIEDAAGAVRLADALLEGGLNVIEITFRTKAAAAAIEAIATERPAMVVGCGTVLTVEDLNAAADAGARFGVSPGLNPHVVEAAVDMGFPFAPGVMTPSEVEQGLGFGLKLLKLFPAGAAGGPGYLKALAGPYAHTGVRFVPTGGVTVENMGEYLSQKVCAAVGGTWVAKKDVIAAGTWSEIASAAAAAVAKVKELRGT